MPTFAISDFVRRQTKKSRFSHFEGSYIELLALVEDNFNKAKPGYRDGVCLVPVPSENFFTGVVQLKEGDKLKGVFAPRYPGEKPRKSTWLSGGDKIPAKQVDIVLYRSDVLSENNSRSSNADWEIISINASPIEGEEVPIPVGSLLANHFNLSGGTATNMSNDEFVETLRKSVLWWQDKTFLGD